MSVDPKLIAAAIEKMPLVRVQKLLRAVCGTPFRCCDDPIYRQELWRRLDQLVREGKAPCSISTGPISRNGR